MGFFDSVKKVATSPVGSTVGGFMLGGPLGAGAGYLAGKAIRGAGQGQPEVDPYDEKRKAYFDALESQRARMADMSDKFRKEAPGIQAKGEAAIGDEERKAAKEGIQDIRKGASRRGLLYSGLRQGAEAGRIGESQSRIAGRAAELNDQIESTKQAFDAQAVQAGINQKAAQAGIAGQDYTSSLEKALEKRKALSGIGKSLGSMGGMAAGGAFGGGSGGGAA